MKVKYHVAIVLFRRKKWIYETSGARFRKLSLCYRIFENVSLLVVRVSKIITKVKNVASIMLFRTKNDIGICETPILLGFGPWDFRKSMPTILWSDFRKCLRKLRTLRQLCYLELRMTLYLRNLNSAGLLS